MAKGLGLLTAGLWVMAAAGWPVRKAAHVTDRSEVNHVQ